ncbi:hypothetical protein [Nocardia xishanensis]
MDGNDNSANRILWSELPGVVRAEVEDRLGARVRAATTQPGGFSHGLAARLEIGDRRGVFAKAIPTDDGLAAMYRTELETAARLPPTVPTPALRFGLDTHGWLVAVFDYVPGRHPRIDRPDELSAILATVEQLAITLTPGPLPDLPTIAQDYGRPTTRLVIQPQAPPRTSCTIGEFGNSLGIDLRLAGAIRADAAAIRPRAMRSTAPPLAARKPARATDHYLTATVDPPAPAAARHCVGLHP